MSEVIEDHKWVDVFQVVRKDVLRPNAVSLTTLGQDWVGQAIFLTICVLFDKIVPVAAEESVQKFDIILHYPVIIDLREEQRASVLLVVEDTQAFYHKPIGLVFDIFD